MRALIRRLLTPREDWRSAGTRAWHTTEAAGEYEYQHYCEKEVRFPDGAVRWVRLPSRPGSNERIVGRHGSA